VAPPRWSIRNYNTFIRDAREEWGISLGEARELYREVRDWKAAPAYGADVDRYADYLQSETGQADVVDSVLYDLDTVPDAEPAPFGYYPDDYMLDEGAEVELSASTYKSDEG
jgi:hypothetical protein